MSFYIKIVFISFHSLTGAENRSVRAAAAQRTGWACGDNAEDGWGPRRWSAEDVGFLTNTLGAHRCNIGDVY